MILHVHEYETASVSYIWWMLATSLIVEIKKTGKRFRKF